MQDAKQGLYQMNNPPSHIRSMLSCYYEYESHFNSSYCKRRTNVELKFEFQNIVWKYSGEKEKRRREKM